MLTHRRQRFLVALAGLVMFATWPGIAKAEGSRGYFCFSVSIEGEGAFWNPVLKSATVVKVEAASPAAAAGMVAGERITEVEGKTVAGTRANDIQPLMKKNVGEPLRLRVQRDNGDLRSVTLVAVRVPIEPDRYGTRRWRQWPWKLSASF